MWPNPQQSSDLVTFTEKIYNGKHHPLCIGIIFNKKLHHSWIFDTVLNILLHNVNYAYIKKLVISKLVILIRDSESAKLLKIASVQFQSLHSIEVYHFLQYVCDIVLKPGGGQRLSQNPQKHPKWRALPT